MHRHGVLPWRINGEQECDFPSGGSDTCAAKSTRPICMKSPKERIQIEMEAGDKGEEKVGETECTQRKLSLKYFAYITE